MATTTWRNPRRFRLALGMIAAATVTAATVPPVQSTSGTSPAHLLTLDGSKWGDKDTDSVAKGGDTYNHPDKDPGSMYVITGAVGARALWQRTDASRQPLTGAGVTVALLDSGVTPVPGLNSPGQVVYGPDFSTSDGSNSGSVDGYGHGTFMAGLIAANDHPTSSGKPVPLPSAKADMQLGVAPGAQLLSLKLAGADGATSVDAVIAALAWVVQHKNDNGMHVRVVNLSFGARALQPYQQDPLAAAVERAWNAGIVVVASAGNDGPTSAGVDDPALDPYVISVGATDPSLKVNGWDPKKATVASFSDAGTAARPVDIVAPGRSVAGLRVPGSTIDVTYPEGRIGGDPAGRLFRGSGTSEATAIVTGAVALLLQAHPTLTPDQVKALLKGSADPLGQDVRVAGAGQIDLGSALLLSDRIGTNDPRAAAVVAAAVQTWAPSTGLAGIDPGEITGSWNGPRWSGARWRGATWSGATWSGARWRSYGWS